MGVRVAPPTNRISSTCDAVRFAEFERDMNRSERLLDERRDHLLVLVPAQFQIQIDRPAVLFGQIFLLDARERMIRQLFLRRLRPPCHPRHRPGLTGDIDAVFELQMFQRMLDDLVIEIIAAEMIVAMAGDDLHNAALDPHDGDVERSAAEVVDENPFPLMVGGFVNERRRRGFVDDPHDFETGDLARLARCLALRVGKVGRHGDYRLLNRMSQPLPRDLLQPRQDHRGNLLRRVIALAQTHLVVAAHAPFDRADGPLGIQQILVAGLLADEQFAGFRQCDDRRQNDPAALVAEHLRTAIAVNRNLRICRPKVDAEDLVRHVVSPVRVPALLTITSAVRSTCSSQRKPVRTSSITVPSGAALSAEVATTRACRGSKG